MQGSTDAGVTRRTVVAGAGLAAVSAVTGCSVYGESGSGEGSASAPSAAPGAPLAKTADIPVGGGQVFADQKVVITQPAQGDFKAFTAVCTHQGCTVSTVEGGTINCACHGSRFKVADGSVANGPAPSALAPKTIKVEGDAISLA
jgi:Rieske Fe-S protein